MAKFNQYRRKIAKYPEKSKRNRVNRNNSATVNKLNRITCSKLVWESERDLKHEIPRMKETVEAHAKNAPESPSKKSIR